MLMVRWFCFRMLICRKMASSSSVRTRASSGVSSHETRSSMRSCWYLRRLSSLALRRWMESMRRELMTFCTWATSFPGVADSARMRTKGFCSRICFTVVE